MDAASYKKHLTTRGFTYNYYFSAAQPKKPTLVFLHGFPSSSWDWTSQAAFFKARGYGLIIPDMLGYAGTDKPTDPKEYVGSKLAKDIVDIMDNESVQKAIAIGHDWGVRPTSRLANYYPDRFIAFGFLAAGYAPPNPVHNPAAQAAAIRQLVGRDLFAYWDFFTEEGADKKIEQNFDSFFSLFFPNPPELWRETVTKIGATKVWIEGNKQSPAPAYVAPEFKEHYRKTLLEGGFAGPLCWYSVNTEGLAAEDDTQVPLSSYEIHHPVFFGAALKDEICLPMFGKGALQRLAKGPVTIKEFDGDHWFIISHAEELNGELLAWLEGLNA